VQLFFCGQVGQLMRAAGWASTGQRAQCLGSPCTFYGLMGRPVGPDPYCHP